MDKKLILILLATLVLAFGCQQGDDQSAEKLKPYIGGTTGLIATFTEDAPPAEVYDGGDFPFDIEVKLQNDGETDVKKDDIVIKVSGIDPVEFGKTQEQTKSNAPEDLLAKYKDPEGNIIESNPVYVIFDDFNHESSVAGNLEYPVSAKICYKYATEAVSRLCIKSNLNEQGGVCTVTEDKQVLNSGAPIQVTQLSESVAGTNKIAFIFKIEKKGNGNIYKVGTKCSEARADADKVLVSVDTAMPNLQCAGLADGTATSGYLTLRGGSSTVRCIQQLATETSFLKVVSVKVDYDYQDEISTTILLKHAE